MAGENEAVEPQANEGSAPDRTVEDRAIEMGWVPENQFKGDKSRFISAADFVKRGEEMLPVIRANSRRVEARLDDATRQNNVLQGQLNEALNKIDELQQAHGRTSVDTLKAKRDEMADELKIAREAGNTRRELEIMGEVEDVNAQIREAEKVAGTAPVKRETSPATSVIETPEFKAFAQENPWFGSDRIKTAIAVGIGQALRAENPNLVGKAFYDRVSEEFERQTGGNSRRNGTSKVEGGVRGTSQGGGPATGKTFSDLPADARAACHSMASRVVGANKKFKTMAEWQASYAEKYFE